MSQTHVAVTHVAIRTHVYMRILVVPPISCVAGGTPTNSPEDTMYILYTYIPKYTICIVYMYIPKDMLALKTGKQPVFDIGVFLSYGVDAMNHVLPCPGAMAIHIIWKKNGPKRFPKLVRTTILDPF